MKPDKIETFPAPDDPIYVCVDDEGNHFLYVGEDTFSRLDAGPQRDHWMKKLAEGKVKMHEIAGTMILDVATGNTTLRHSDDWEMPPDVEFE